MNRKTVSVFAALSTVLFASACGVMPTDRLGASVSYSAIGTAPPVGARVVATMSRKAALGLGADSRLISLSDESMLKPELAPDKRGQLVGRFTPEDFFLCVGQLTVYNRVGETFTFSSLLTQSLFYAGMDTPTISLIHSKDYLEDLVLHNGNHYQGFALMPGYNDIPVDNVVLVDLGDEYSAISFPRESTIRQGTGLSLPIHLFSMLEDLIPFKSDGMYFISFGSDMDEAMLVDTSVDLSPYPSPCGPLNGTMGQFYFPGPELDFSAYDRPEVVIYWEMENLIEVYDHGTPADPSDDLVTFALDDPFPISIVLREKVDPAVVPGDTQAPGPVRFETCMGISSNLKIITKVSWVNPVDDDFAKVIIRRKAGSAPIGTDEGEQVFEGRRSTYFDETGIAGTEYFYSVVAVDYSGNRSEPAYSSWIAGDEY